MSAIQSATPYLALTGGTVTGNITDNGHLQFGGTTPGVAIAAGAGSSPPTPAVVLASGSNDCAGAITWGTGTAPNTQAQLTVTFSTPFVIPGGGAPHIVLCAANSATAALNIFHSGASPTGFNVGVVTAPAASQANTTYSFTYVVLG